MTPQISKLLPACRTPMRDRWHRRGRQAADLVLLVDPRLDELQPVEAVRWTCIVRQMSPDHRRRAEHDGAVLFAQQRGFPIRDGQQPFERVEVRQGAVPGRVRAGARRALEFVPAQLREARELTRITMRHPRDTTERRQPLPSESAREASSAGKRPAPRCSRT